MVRNEKWLRADIVENKYLTTNIYRIRQHEIETEDAILQLGQQSFEDTLYDLQQSHHHKMYPNSNSPGAFFETEFVLDQYGIKHVRIAYNLMDVLGDLAGVFDLAVHLVGFFILSISQHSMTISTIKKLFLVRTSDDTIFVAKDRTLKKDGISKYLGPEITECIADVNLRNEVLKHNKKISITQNQSINLYFQNLYNKWIDVCCCPRKCCKPKVNKLTVLYQECEERLEKSLDILKLLKDVKYMKLLLKFKINPEIETKF